MLLLLLPVVLHAQNRELTRESDTTFWFPRYIARFCNDLEIPTIGNCKKSNEIRFWDDYKVIRLWNEGDHLEGEVIYFVYQYKKADAFNKYFQGKVHYEKMSLSERTLSFIEYMISDFNINQIPSESLIENWPEGNDGSIGIIESCSPTSYTFKSYALGWIKLKEARYIQYFFSQLNNIGEIERGHEKFIKAQPFRIYRKGWSKIGLGFSSFLSRWRFVLYRKLFGRMSDRRFYRKRAKEKGLEQ